MPAKLTSRFPQIAAQLKPRIDQALEQTAAAVRDDAKQRVPVDSGKLRTAIHTEHPQVGEHRVVAGDDDAFYGHMVEHGTSHSSPHPFLVPAAEAHRDTLERAAHTVLEGL